MRWLAFLSVLTLASCNQPSDSSLESGRVAALEGRVAELERQIVDLKEADANRAAEAKVQPKVETAPARVMTHALVNTSFQNDRERRYQSRQACEAAKEQLLADWRADDEAKRSRGVVFTSRPTPSCIPI